jgi:SagB-type dehydrogenase family enzyme
VSQSANFVDARWLAQSFSNDPDVSLPERPRLIPELVGVPYGADGILFAGGEHTELVRGKSTRTLLPRVLPLLDGTRTLPALAEALADIPPQHVVSIVTLLYSRGLLEDGPAEAHPLPHVASFAGRYVDCSRINHNRGEALARLGAARVRVSGTHEVAAMLVRDLRDSGIDAVRAEGRGVRAEGRGPRAEGDDEADVEVFVASGDFDDADAIDAITRNGGRAYLLSIGAREAQIGPLFLPGVTSCARCLVRNFGRPAGEADPLFARMAASLASLQIFHALGRIASGSLHTSFRILGIEEDGTWIQDTRLATRTPGCAACGLGGDAMPADDARAAAWIYHGSTSFQTHELIGPKDHQAHYAVANIKLASEKKTRLFSGDTVPLPPPMHASGDAPWLASAPAPQTRANLEHVATLLARAAGEIALEGGGTRRVAPTGGNLGSVDLWLLAHDVDGLARAVYHYDPPRHQLEYVRELNPEEMMAAFGDAALETQCFLIGTGALSKIAQKYKSFAYRLIQYDSGVALAYLHELARYFGLPLREAGDFHDGETANVLGISRRWEFPLTTFVAAIGGRTPFAPPRAQGVPAPLKISDRSVDSVHRLIEESAEIAPAIFTSTNPIAAPRRASLPAPLRSFDEILFTRRALREWSTAPVDENLILDLLQRADAMLQQRRAAGASRSHVRAIAVVARGNAGIYELDGDALRFRAPIDDAQYKRCVNQISLGRSSASIVTIANLDTALAQRGARGYREAAIDAGAAIGAAWLAATAHGLTGSAAGGTVASGFRETCGMDGYVECPLLAFHFGWPAGGAR